MNGIGFLKILMATAAISLGMSSGVAAQSAYPTRLVTIVAAFPPGGTVDLLARTLGQKLGEEWSQKVIVENRPGGSGIVGSQAVAQAAPDGYTLMVIPITHVTNASLHSKLPFDPIADFTPIILLASSPLVLVANRSLPFNSVRDVIAAAKANPGKLNCGSGGNGTSQHLACELFKNVAQVNLQHVPYKGNAAAMTDVIGGHIEMLFDQMATAVPHIKEEKVKAIALTSLARSPAMPDIPTVAEAGFPGFEATAWFGVVGPPKMPKELVERIRAAFAKALAMPDVKDRLAAQGLVLIGSSPDEFGTYIKSELGKWGDVIRKAGIKVE